MAVKIKLTRLGKIRNPQYRISVADARPRREDGLDVLLRGGQSVVVGPARSIHGVRIPVAWRPALADGRLLLLSPFA